MAKFLLKAQPKIITLDKNTRKARQYLKVEEDCENGKFNFMEIRNGDQTNLEGPNFGFEPLILYASLTER